MMKSRVITALLIVAVVVPVVFISVNTFRILAIIIAAFGIHEFLDVFKEKKYSLTSKIIIYTLSILPVVLVTDIFNVSIAWFGIWTLIIFLLMIIDKNIDYYEMSNLYTFMMYLIATTTSAMWLRSNDDGFYLIMFSIFVTSASDTGALLAGKLFGKHKLIERISPNKTIEGSIGGIVASLVMGLVLYLIMPMQIDSIPMALLFSLVLAITGQLGDLFFSKIKRTMNIKDFSNMLPGHGGILDRIDSHLTNFLVLCLLLVFWKGLF
ncbi:phosphatidate cytidylyltransferase [Mycoplasma sp. P36-A1]|uniref:phosphatidate cytidylyltransferase n=1 Tax=Mycoplasma sp. P36-A1 TaxID=3252900 RepID=UPI003C2C72D3